MLVFTNMSVIAVVRDERPCLRHGSTMLPHNEYLLQTGADPGVASIVCSLDCTTIPDVEPAPQTRPDPAGPTAPVAPGTVPDPEPGLGRL